MYMFNKDSYEIILKVLDQFHVYALRLYNYELEF